jgi:glycosidase
VAFALQNLADSHDTPRLATMIANARAEGAAARPWQRPEMADYDVNGHASVRRNPGLVVTEPDASGRLVQRLVALFQFTFAGAPMIYYGTEAGMIGADDPDDRMPMVWPDMKYKDRVRGPAGPLPKAEPVRFDENLFVYYQQLARLRHESEALRRGQFEVLLADDHQQVLVFHRRGKHESILVALNRAEQHAQVLVEPPDPPGVADQWQLQFESAGPASGCKLQRHDDRGLHLELPPLAGAVWNSGQPD